MIKSRLKFVRQLFINLLHNSIIYSDTGASITIEIKNTYNPHIRKNILNISIQDKAKPITTKLKKSLPILNPKSILDWKFINNHDRV